MIVADTSAIVAIFLREVETPLFLEHLAQSDSRISVSAALESTMVIRGKKLPASEHAERWLDDLLATLNISIEPVLADDLRLAREAHLRFGKGTGHPAQLNFGDCFSYALARRLGAPLLYKGNDFGQTDIQSAL